MKLDNIAALAAEHTGDAVIVSSPASPPVCLPRAEGRVSAWTDKRGACDERASRELKGASVSGLRSEELATNDEGRSRLKGAGGERG